MMKVGVQLHDLDFAHAMMRGLAAEGRGISFSLLDAPFEMTDYDLILIEDEPVSSRQIELVFYPEEERIHEGPPYKLFRYRDVCGFVGNLLLIYYRETGRKPVLTGEHCCRTFAFTSLSGGPEATALALAMGELLYTHFGQRCLYLNLCPIDVSKCFLPSGSSKGLLTLLYYLDEEKDFPLEAFIERYLHVDYISTNLSNSYFDEMRPEMMYQLLEKIDDLGRYGYLFLDIGNHLSRNNKALLAHAEEVILVTGSTEQYPASFSEDVMMLLQNLATETRIRQSSFELQTLEKQAELMIDENGLMSLPAWKNVQWEAGRLVKEMMEHANH